MLACVLLFLLSHGISTVSAVTRVYNLTLQKGEASPDGFARPVYLINGQQTGPLIQADQGDILEVAVFNDLDVENTIHWHGLLQRGTPDMDGVPGVTQVPIPPGGNFTYHIPLEDQYGFYWYHSHFKTYYNDAIRGPLVINPSPSVRRPYAQLARNTTETKALHWAEENAMPLLLADWYHNVSKIVYQQYFKTGAFPGCVNSLLANGRGRVRCLPEDALVADLPLGLGSNYTDMSSSTSQNPSMKSMMPSMTEPSSAQGGTISSSSMATSPRDTSMMTTYSMTQSPGTPLMPMSMLKRAPSMSPTESNSGMQESSLNKLGCTPPMMFNPGYSMDSLSSVTCTNTSAPLLTIPADASQGWLALHIVNAGATSELRVSIDAHSMFVFAADGLYVEMQEVKVLPIAIGQRYSVLVRLDQSPGQYYLRFASYPVGDMQQVIEDQAVVEYIHNTGSGAPYNTVDLYDTTQSTWMLVNGSAKGSASVLDESKLSPFEANPPPVGVAGLTKTFMINQTDPVVWVVDKAPYSEPQIPIIFGNASDGWSANTTLHMPYNTTIDIVMQISNRSMDTMGHPMHLHGHKFWVLGTGTGPFPYSVVTAAPSSMINLQDPPYRDTVELPASGWAAIRYVTDNPGAWLFHCHIQWHLVSGMALVLVEGDSLIPALLDGSSNATKTSKPSSAVPSGLSGPIISPVASQPMSSANHITATDGLLMALLSMLYAYAE